MANTELAPRLHLPAIIRTVLLIFTFFFLLNAQTCPQSDNSLSFSSTCIPDVLASNSSIRAAIGISWTIFATNILILLFTSLHPHLQRLADGLPFPIKVTVRGRTVLSYGDSEEGDGLFAPLSGKLLLAFIDVILATALLVATLVAKDEKVENWSPAPGFPGMIDLKLQRWVVNAWITLLTFQYVVAVLQMGEAGSIWYKRRYVESRGHISLA